MSQGILSRRNSSGRGLGHTIRPNLYKSLMLFSLLLSLYILVIYFHYIFICLIFFMSLFISCLFFKIVFNSNFIKDFYSNITFLTHTTHLLPLLCFESFVHQMTSECNLCLRANRHRRRIVTTNTSVLNKGFFIDTPPSFDGDRFKLQKAIFESLIQAIYFEMWNF